MSPSPFILKHSHKIDRTAPLKLSGIPQTWKSDHPKVLPFRKEQSVLMKVNKIGCLIVNKFSKRYKGPIKIITVNPKVNVPLERITLIYIYTDCHRTIY